MSLKLGCLQFGTLQKYGLLCCFFSGRFVEAEVGTVSGFRDQVEEEEVGNVVAWLDSALWVIASVVIGMKSML